MMVTSLNYFFDDVSYSVINFKDNRLPKFKYEYDDHSSFSYIDNFIRFNVIIIHIVSRMQGPVVSSKKITLSSDFFYFDMFPFKKYQECIVKIPETVLLEKGFVREWLFNSHKQTNNPILKKKK